MIDCLKTRKELKAWHGHGQSVSKNVIKHTSVSECYST